MKEGRDINDVLGIPRGKVEGLKGKMRALPAFFSSPVPCCFNKARKGMREGWKESSLEVSYKAQAGAFCSNYRQIGDLDISARWSISW